MSREDAPTSSPKVPAAACHAPPPLSDHTARSRGDSSSVTLAVSPGASGAVFANVRSTRGGSPADGGYRR
eukprot:2397292-Prymnesium_polylepis.1